MLRRFERGFDAELACGRTLPTRARRARLHDQLSKQRQELAAAVVHRDLKGLRAEVEFESAITHA